MNSNALVSATNVCLCVVSPLHWTGPRSGLTMIATLTSAAMLCSSSSGFTARHKLTSLDHRRRQQQQPHRPLRNGATRRAVIVRSERSFVMIKPDGVQRGLVSEIVGRFERKGFRIQGLKMFQCSEELAKEHYKDLSEKPFFGGLVGYITSGPVVCIALEGDGVVASARKMIGATKPLEAEPGTIRGDLAIEVGRNVVHGSDSAENGERELGLWFKEDELVAYEPALTPWIKELDR